MIYTSACDVPDVGSHRLKMDLAWLALWPVGDALASLAVGLEWRYLLLVLQRYITGESWKVHGIIIKTM